MQSRILSRTESSEQAQHAEIMIPTTDANGIINISRAQYMSRLAAIRRKEPLREACIDANLAPPKSANLERLRTMLTDYWYPPIVMEESISNEVSELQSSSSQHASTSVSVLRDNNDEILVQEFGVEGAAAEEVLGYDDDSDSDPEDEFREVLEINDELLDHTALEDDDESDLETQMQGGPFPGESYTKFQTRIRLEETRRAENNRRAGGVKTQSAVIKDWKIFCGHALKTGQIKDEIVDAHHLLLYIRYCSERPKRTRKGIDIPGTFIGASHIKKLYFGALRIRKEQEAKDPSLSQRRPATNVHVWDALKGRMNEALRRAREGLIPEEDAPDIVANTFLSGITEAQMNSVGKGFLMHRELRSVINGHLSWTAQNASGNRGDDFRALRLAELQPYVFLHPNKETAIPCVLGCQGEEKAGASRGMRTKVNPVYSVFIAHLDPVKCPLGAFAFYHHFLHDVIDITSALDINWSINKTWRQVRVLHGKKSYATPYHEQSLYNLYVKAFSSAAFTSHLKAHLPRHILGYNQERMGVDPSVTSRMGWVRGETYYDTYAPALPKEAVLGAHGYKSHEVYDPIWRHVHIPEVFLCLVCPMAETIYSDVVGRQNLSGAANYWSMVMELRPYLFQCGAAIFQEVPESALFRLPAFAHQDVQNWMKHQFPNDFSLLKASAGSRVDLQRIQNQLLQLALEETRSLLASQSVQLAEVARIQKIVEQRTQVLSPAKGYSAVHYSSRVSTASSAAVHEPLPALQLTTANHDTFESANCENDDTGVYMAENGDFRAFANGSPKTPTHTIRRKRSQVDLVLPSASAFTEQGQPQFFWPPVFGQKSVTWDQVFALIKQPEHLWDCWKPSKTLDKYDLHDQWACWSVGEGVNDADGNQTSVKPPLREVERHFGSFNPEGKHLKSWRSGISSKDRKFWQRFREIPEFIDSEAHNRKVSPLSIIDELEILGQQDRRLKGLSALTKHIKLKREAVSPQAETEAPQVEAEASQPTKRKKAVAPRRPSKKAKQDEL
ncbi:hypothetical protein JR316_0010486 [Psilocybe cubensis]|uniref:Ndc10 domain-containing protein n=3 Tax=Psilocybe cubensis TaxID=181762 RepID=A0A8H7XLC4_PSICU|nr:hypothetical protein JR316_0010482 [Psilocybe cubensis]XP_047744199.1 hypothetical protein JR316_0010486 [Psilocybe cubensis]KAH9476570.1 hypothetical protein JR316_0010482 [Psilocybe cubensis]KAH9476574.1 hypothetical protein JR316_0010486 [Psilocybe cubensis]